MKLPTPHEFSQDRFVRSKSVNSRFDLKARLELIPDSPNEPLKPPTAYSQLLADQIFSPEKMNTNFGTFSSSKKARKRLQFDSFMLNSTISRKLNFLKGATEYHDKPNVINLESVPSLLLNKAQFRKEPYKILEAKGLRNDFYLSLLSWSSKDQIAMGIDKTITLFDVKKNVFDDLTRIDDYSEYVSAVAFTSDGSSVLFADNRGNLNKLNVVKYSRSSFNNHHKGRICSIAVSESDIVATGSADKQIKLFDFRAKSHIDILSNHSQEICGLSWSKNGLLASGGNDNKVCVWDNRLTKTPMMTIKKHKSAVKALTWSPIKTSVLVTGGGTQDRNLCLWEVNSGKELNCTFTNNQICNVFVDKMSKHIICCNGFSSNDIKVYDFNSLKCVASLEGHKERVIYMAVNPEGEKMVTGAGNESIHFWELYKEKEAQPELDDFFNFR